MSDKKIASLPTHTRHQSVSGPYPVLAAHPAENHRWVRPRGQPGTTGRGSLIKRPASRPSRRAPQQNAYGAGNPAAAAGNRPQHHHSEVVDWGRSGPNQMITLNALRALKAAGRLTLPAIRT